MATIKATTKAGQTVTIQDSKVAYTHAWFVTTENGTRIVEKGFTEKGEQAAKRAGARAMASNKDCGFRNEQGKFVSWKTLGLDYEVVAVEK
jgi:hypothetical protein